MRLVVFIIVSLLLLAPQVAGATVIATWDDPADGLDGWDASGTGTWIEYSATGGNSGGYIKIGGNRTIGFKNTTADFTGNYASRGFNGASFDMMVLLQQLPAYKPSLVFRYSPSYNGWEYVLNDFTIENAGTWQHFDIQFDPLWSDAEAVANGWAPVDTYMLKPFSETLTHVDAFTIFSDYPSNVAKVLGLDNVMLNGNAAVPEPVSSSLFIMGAIGMGLSRIRKKRAQK
ncbi:MAG: hypothetical protein KBB52_00925 [Candidatus Omnitrophica bacterium]|nr:hypothetical protein [Candidatus Omnitrophota bacterium]